MIKHIADEKSSYSLEEALNNLNGDLSNINNLKHISEYLIDRITDLPFNGEPMDWNNRNQVNQLIELSDFDL